MRGASVDRGSVSDELALRAVDEPGLSLPGRQGDRGADADIKVRKSDRVSRAGLGPGGRFARGESLHLVAVAGSSRRAEVREGQDGAVERGDRGPVPGDDVALRASDRRPGE